MKDAECVAFLQEVLPRLRMRWAGFRKVRGQVCKRISRRIRELGIPDIGAYRRYLHEHTSEWDMLYRLCRVTISRFYRDRLVFDHLSAEVLPAIAATAQAAVDADVRAWSAGCAGGEEAHTLQIVWRLCVAASVSGAPRLSVIATDIDAHLLERARTGLYPASALGDLPEELAKRAFDKADRGYTIREAFKRNIHFSMQDIREHMPDGSFHLVLCRNLVFTYFDEPLQRELLAKISDRLVPGGFFVIGAHEKLPARTSLRIESHTPPCIFRKDGDSAPRSSSA